MKNEENLHTGHRERLRRRFLEEGSLDSFTDEQFLELLLFYARARGDTNELAHGLLDRFTTLKGVLEAGPDQLLSVKGIGPESATLISMVVPMTRRYNRCLMADPLRITSCTDAERYCLSLSEGRRVERFYVICLDAGCRLLGCRMISEGSLSEVSAYPRRVAEAALTLNAHSVLLTHNHPGGTVAPSEDDIRSTLQLQQLLSSLGVTLLDHIIVAGDTAYSMVRHGDITYSVPNG